MSNPIAGLSEAQKVMDAAFAEGMRSQEGRRYIKRHSRQARFTHGFTVVTCFWLIISGLFVFVPALNAAAGADVVFAMRMSHRVIGLLFVVVPIISGLTAPRGVYHVVRDLFSKWDSDDVKWMLLFFPYLFGARWIHMPDQGKLKSGQKFADGMMWLICLLMAVSGVALLLGSTVVDMAAGTRAVFLVLHDVGFFLLCVFGMAHIFLGAGIFQPYRGCANLMFGDGMVSESDALYHWGHWARAELESGENVVVRGSQHADKPVIGKDGKLQK
jgi:formate dehydrogenase subunit gamma